MAEAEVGMSEKRSPEARKRRAAKRRQAIAASKPPYWTADAGRLCRRCFVREHVPLSEFCRACRYYERAP